MILAYLLLLTGLTISSVAIYYSVVGLTAIFSAAAVPIMIMGVSLEVAKLVCATWIKQHWAQVPRLMKIYMCIAITVLMLITSLGIFGFLSKAHNDQNLVSGDVGAKLAIYDEKIATARSNIEADRKQLAQMDAAVDQVMSRSTSENGADKANAIRNSQKRDRAQLAKDIETNQTIISKLNDEAAPIRAENRKVEAEVGPIKYIAAFIYGVAPDAGMLERAVTWIIIMIVIVFDPLAVIMLLASQMTFAWNNTPKEETAKIVVDPSKDVEESDYDIPLFDEVEIPDLTDYSEGHIPDPEPEEDLPVSKKRFHGFAFPMSTFFGKPKEVEEIKYREGDYSSFVPHNNFIEQVYPDVDLVTGTPEIVDEPKSDYNTSMDERPGDYVEPPEPVRPTIPEAAPGRNRGVMHTHLVQADNTSVQLGKAANSDFGNTYPPNPKKGDVYLRTDSLPNRLFKFNGQKWIEIDKDTTDVYAYNELYIRHLIDQIDQGRHDTDSLTEVEREQIAEYLRKNA